MKNKMSGSTILSAKMDIHRIQQEIEKREADPEYAEACNKIDPIMGKYRGLARRIQKYALGGGLVTGTIVGVATGYSLRDYLPDNMQMGGLEIGKYPIFYFAVLGLIIGEIAGGVIGLSKKSKLERKAKEEIDNLGLEYTVGEHCF